MHTGLHIYEDGQTTNVKDHVSFAVVQVRSGPQNGTGEVSLYFTTLKQVEDFAQIMLTQAQAIRDERDEDEQWIEMLPDGQSVVHN